MNVAEANMALIVRIKLLFFLPSLAAVGQLAVNGTGAIDNALR